MNEADAVVYLASCAINNNTPDKSLISEMNIEKVYSFASKHMLSTIVAIALESAGYKDSYSNKAIANALRRTIIFEKNRVSLFQKLEQAGIWYMPLKGVILKDFYPKIIMREMSDHDILFDISRAGDVKNIMENLGFTTKSFNVGNHDIYYKKPFCNFEMHRKLFGISHDEKFYEYYSDIKQLLIKDNGNNYGYHFNPKDFYIYMVAHEYKHYSVGGTGLRSILDIYVFLKKFGKNLDLDYIATVIEKLGISNFEQRNRMFALDLFSNNEIMYENLEMFKYIIHSGAYGKLDNSVKNALKKCGEGKKGKIKYLMMKIFPQRYKIKNAYPILSRYKALYPILVIYRFIKAVLCKQQEILQELKILFRL